MNQKDYKEIAKVIIDVNFISEGSREITANRLADYFEKSFGYCGRKWGVVYCDIDTPCYICKRDKFNRKQFLIDCGVTKNE